jgi:exonuclease SbcD
VLRHRRQSRRRSAPRLAERLGGGLRLIGAGGTWERVELLGEEHPLDLLGWSFGRARETRDPTEDPRFGELSRSIDGRPALGVLHGELDKSPSQHAPIARHRLAASGCKAWLLGHYHRPDAFEGEPPIGYLGSVVGLDPGEPGLHGPCLVELRGELRGELHGELQGEPHGGPLRIERLALAPLRWERVRVSLDDQSARDSEAIEDAIIAALHRHVSSGTGFDAPELRCVAFRIELVGRLADRSALQSYLAERGQGDVTLPGPSEQTWILEQVEDSTLPALDVEQIALQENPLGHVARRILELQQGRGDELVRSADQRCASLAQGRWTAVDLPPPPDTREALERAAWELLEALHAQSQEELE